VGDPIQATLEWMAPESLEEVKALWHLAECDCTVIGFIEQVVPKEVLRSLGLVA